MKWVWQVTISVFLAYGWIWAGILKERNAITDNQRMYILAGLGLFFLGQQIAISKPKPRHRDSVEKQRSIAENCLGSLLIDYRAKLIEKNLPVPQIYRANLALPTRLWFRWRMKIYYSACSDNTAYSADELNLKWKKGCGTTGYAWKTKDITLFDSVNPKYSGPIQSIGKDEMEIVSYLKSVIAVPIISTGGKVIGVLVMDSTDNLEITNFHEQWLIKLAQAYANTIEPMCFFDGVC